MERETPRGAQRVAGVDEAGRGSLAGPVVAAAVVLSRGGETALSGLTDSKLLTPTAREALYAAIVDVAEDVGVGVVEERVIESRNILRASLLAMERAVCSLSVTPDLLLIDGIHPLSLSLPQEAIPHGDRLIPAISAASVVAKVVRDRMMDVYDRSFPGYGFRQHKGYGTEAHRRCLALLGPSVIHRRGFRGVREYLAKGDG